jgi:hypothetical protein
MESDMKIYLTKPATWPKIDTRWQHHNGNLYVVQGYANVEVDRQDLYPTTIIYKNFYTGSVYCRKLIDWERSMTAERDGT